MRRRHVLRGLEIERLALQVVGHVLEDRPDAGVELGACKFTAMLGLTPKLLRSMFHRENRLTYVSYVPPNRRRSAYSSGA